jgi:putative phosphoribosyl transferase
MLLSERHRLECLVWRRVVRLLVTRYLDRVDAGRRLGERLQDLRDADVVVLGLPRGGVPVAVGVAQALGAPLDVIIVRKLGVPRQPEFAMGALGEGGVRIVNDQIVAMARVSQQELAAIEAGERAELERRAERFRAGRRPVPITGRTVIVVDDGIATGSTARAACRVARAQGAARVILAVPVGHADAIKSLRSDADEVICLTEPRSLQAIGEWYEDFSQTSDEEVVSLLSEAANAQTAGPAWMDQESDAANAQTAGPAWIDQEVVLYAGSAELAGHLTRPARAAGLVLFVHGSGSSRRSPRNRLVAGALHGAGLGTVLFDLLTPAEELDRGNVFDIELLAQRLLEITRQLAQPGTRIGYFGASTGAAAALWAAAEPGNEVGAVVSRGGRPDLAAQRLPLVSAPTLLIVGGADQPVLDFNARAQRELRCENKLAVIPGATHLFEEPGALPAVAGLAQDWFTTYLAAGADHRNSAL